MPDESASIIPGQAHLGVMEGRSERLVGHARRIPGSETMRVCVFRAGRAMLLKRSVPHEEPLKVYNGRKSRVADAAFYLF
jgi:hypothetical protein